ncbi:hypothetical protein FA10DRAFT_264034 [Acaromyces ingoldii]|uniref:Nucleoporin Nup54 alpha-helical domain-containing protein n=1 Tax=Acaromyces ingoldii TaxID=215250 RepID=A0A316YWF8_9BASI|nr:hypothetical protein FA10DRAFT_264034 [Acaromyces ingoldii]PWN93376.1 hypothetical protein FA10DRAFT_264034 [Acaromyces ingoldii]
MAFSFGKPPGSAPATQTSTPGFSFGGNTAQQQQPQTGGGSLFGGGQQQQPGQGGGGFSFGGAQNTTQQQPPQQQQQQQSQAQMGQLGGGFSFGGTSSSQPQPQQQQNQQAGSGGLFGSTSQAPGQQNNNSLFGAPSTLNNQPQQQQNSLFASSTAGPLTLSQLGGQPSYQLNNQQQQQKGLGAPPQGGQQQTQQQQQQQQQQQGNKRLGTPMNAKMEALRSAWNTQDIQVCQFLFYFYNALPPNVPGLAEAVMANSNFGRRQDAVGPRHEALWARTLQENPDRSRLVPVLAVGFQDLKTRVDLQHGEATRQRARLTELSSRLSSLSQKHSLSDSVRLEAISRRQTTLHHRLVGIARKSHLLIPALRGRSVTADEDRLRVTLEACEAELEAVGGGAGSRGGVAHGRLRARVNELWAQLGAIKAKKEALGSEVGDATEWAVVDENGLEDVAKILGSQQQGLNHLSTTLETDEKGLDTVVKGLEGVQLIGVKGVLSARG